jgi:hypothetical protein
LIGRLDSRCWSGWGAICGEAPDSNSALGTVSPGRWGCVRCDNAGPQPPCPLLPHAR